MLSCLEEPPAEKKNVRTRFKQLDSHPSGSSVTGTGRSDAENETRSRSGKTNSVHEFIGVRDGCGFGFTIKLSSEHSDNFIHVLITSVAYIGTVDKITISRCVDRRSSLPIDVLCKTHRSACTVAHRLGPPGFMDVARYQTAILGILRREGHYPILDLCGFFVTFRMLDSDVIITIPISYTSIFNHSLTGNPSHYITHHRAAIIIWSSSHAWALCFSKAVQ
ncbi:hypothetical protein BJV78DRAFT_197268 [Lactifluus subvellereus]|nr:hypothetical protein BJV78DRAFT_197268 [Lactifluus subvellereus]